MNTITITPAVIEMFQKSLTDPKGNNLPFDSMAECFEKSETVTAKHTLAEQYQKRINRQIPKLILYIVMDNVFGQCDGKDSSGCLGYHLKVKE